MPIVKPGRVVLLVMLASACSSTNTTSPTPTPTPVSPASILRSYAGTWTGQFQLASSSSVAMCGPAGRALGDVDDLELTLRASDGDLTGNLNVSVMCTSSFAGSTPQTWRKEYVVPVKGTTDGMGNLTLAGESPHTPPGFCGYETFTKLNRWNSTEVNGGQRLNGSFVFIAQHGISSCYHTTSTLVGDLLNVSRTGT